MSFLSIRQGLTLIAILCPLWVNAEVEFERVWPGYRSAESFTTISEYFGSAPAGNNREALRTQPAARDGYYWLARTRSKTAHPGSTLRVEVTREGETEPTAYAFDLDVKTGSNAVFVGLTGTDWADPDAAPIAWRISLVDADGNLLVSRNSFLWNHSDA
mgnify:CR=1 FL=1